MDFSVLLSLVPKLAASLLVVLGILIIIEIRNMLRAKKEERSSPQVVVPERQEVMTRVHFPETAVRTEVKKANVPRSRKPFLLLFSIPVIVLILFGAVHLITSSQNSSVSTKVVPTPTLPPDKNPPRIIIYQEEKDGNLSIISYDDLKKLEPGTEIIIAVDSTIPISKAEFLVNDELLQSDEMNRTSNEELFIRYTLQPGITNYRIAVSVQ